MFTPPGESGDITGYLQSLRARHCTPDTLSTAHSVLRQIATWSDPIPPSRLTTDALQQWQSLRAAQISGPSLRTQLVYLRGFYRWCLREKIIGEDPSIRLDLPRAPRRLPRPMPEDRFQLALATADVDLRAILGLARWAGLRAAEIARLDWAEVTLDGPEPHLRVVGKGGHHRVVDIAPPLRQVLTDLAGHRGPVIRRRDGAAAPNQPRRISQLAGLHLQGLGIPDTLHALRHSFGTAVYEASRDIRATQEAMGHASLTTTSLYVRVARSNVRAAVLAAAAPPATSAAAPPDVTQALAG